MEEQHFPLSLEGDDVPMVRFMGVTKRYGDLTVLDALDLDVADNETIAIIGPSGSGKTTVLRMLMVLETIDEGIIYVDGKPLAHMEKTAGSSGQARHISAGCVPISEWFFSNSTCFPT